MSDDLDQTDLEARFGQRMLKIYDDGLEIGYRASRFLQKIRETSGIAEAKRLLGKHDVSEGFVQLSLLERLDLSLESVVVKEPEWSALFSEEELAIARRRLEVDESKS